MLSIPVTFELRCTHTVWLICFSVRICFRKQMRKWEDSSEVSLWHCLYREVTKWNLPCEWMLISKLIPPGIWALLYAPDFVFSATTWQTPTKHRLHRSSGTGHISFCLMHSWVWWIWYQHLFHMAKLFHRYWKM